MRILILANYDLGLYQFRRDLIYELLKEHEVYISLPYGRLVEPLKEAGCTFIDTPLDRRGINPVRDLKLIKNYFSILRDVKPDMVITYTIKPNIYGGIACRLRSVPCCVNITGLGTAFQNRGVLRGLVTRLYRLSLKRAKIVFFENCENRQLFLDEKITTAEKTCLLNGAGVNLDDFAPADYPMDSASTRFLFMGRVMKEKGIDELFRAMQMLVDAGIACSLDVLGGYEENYEAVIRRCTEEGWLRYHGFQEDVRPFIANSHCFVLPSWHEGMANTNLESAAMCRPVITSAIHGCLEAVIDGETGFLCNKQDAESLFEAMKRFAALSPEQRRQMGLAGRRHMEEVFDKRMVVDQTIRAIVG